MRPGQRHSGDRSSGRSVESDQLSQSTRPGDQLAKMRAVLAHRTKNPTRISAGLCDSCGCLIDSATGGCKCSE